MHICFICREYPPSLRGGGIASYIKEIAQGLYQAGHQVTVICASDDTKKETTTDDNGVTVIRLKGGDFIIPQIESHYYYRKFRPLYKFNSYRRKLEKIIKSLKGIDIIEVAEYGAENYFLNELKIPIVIRLHAPTFILDKISNFKHKFTISNLIRERLGIKEMEIVKKAQYITSCSNALKNIIIKELGIPQERIKVIHNPIQVDKWKYTKRNFPPSKNIKIILPGAITPLKGGEDLIKACQILRREGIEITLSLIGKESNFANQLRMAYSHEKWLCIEGPISREKLMDLYKTVDIVCNPSWFENMPMTCIEAMLLGSIVIASNTGGIPEIITEGVTGFMTVPHSPDQLAKKIKYVTNLSPLEKMRISNAARKHIVENFSINKILNDMLIYYNYTIKDFRQK